MSRTILPIDWDAHVLAVSKEIAAHNLMAAGRIPANAKRTAQLEKDLAHCQRMAEHGRKIRRGRVA